MTSAIVSNLSVQVADNIAASSKADLNPSESSKDFSQVMSTSFASKANEIQTNQPSEVVSTVKVNQNNAKEIKSYSDDSKQMKLSDEKVAEAKDQVEAFSQDVKEVIKDELEIPEEELVEAMEALAVTVLDLTDNANLATLVSDLNEIDSVALLTDESFANIVTQVSELTEELVETTGLTINQLQDLTVPEEVNTETLTPVVEQAVEEPEILAETSFTAEEVSITAEETPDVVVAVANTDTSVKAEATVTTEEVEPEVDESTVEIQSTSVQAEKSETESSNENASNSDSNNSKSESSSVTVNLHEAINESVTQEVSVTYDVATSEITLSTGETTDVQNIIDQIVELARTSVSSEETTVEMLLNPEGLGKIYMQVSEENGEITAKLYTQNEEVKEALQNQMVMLTEQMQAAGTKVTSVEVSVATHEFEKNLEEGQQENNQDRANNEEQPKRTRSINLNSLDELQGLMTEEEELVAKMMRENGNTMDITA